MRPLALCFLWLVAISATPGASRPIIVACAPGYPGTTEQAQPTMDAFARAVGESGGWGGDRFGAVYHEQLEPGLQRLAQRDSAVALVPLPFYLEFRERLSLRPLLEAVPAAGAEETWSLVARREAVTSSASLAGWSLSAACGYSARFVRRVALREWDRLPDDLSVEFDAKLLGSLRRAAQGEPVAVLLDRSQAAALDALPFADSLEVVARSSPLPSSLVCAVDDRIGAEEEARLRSALLDLAQSASGREVLESLRLSRFETVSSERLRDLERAFRAGADGK